MTPRLRHYLTLGGLSAIALLAYANSFRSGLVFDDGLLLGDARVHKAALANLALIFNHTYFWPLAESGTYRPLATLSYLFNYVILGNAGHAAGYHWINLLLHIGNVLLVFALARRLVRGSLAPFLIAAIWAVHPVLTESVTNIAGRPGLLAGTTTLGGLLIYLRSAESQGRRRWAWLAGLFAITLVGVFSKENAVAIVAVIALYEFTWWNPRRLPGFLLSCLAMAPAFLAMWLARLRIGLGLNAGLIPIPDNPIAGADFWTGRLTAIKVMAKYLELLIWPAHLSADYSYNQIPLATGSQSDWIAWIVVAAVAIGTAFLYRRNKVAFFAMSFAFLTLLPTANLIVPVGTIMAERFLYLPAVGFAICLTLALVYIGERAPAVVWVRAPVVIPIAVGILIVVGFTIRTWERNKDWRDELTFRSESVENAPLSFKTHTGLALALLLEKEPDGDRIYDQDEAGLAILDTLPDRLNEDSRYYNAAAHYVLIGDAVRRLYPNGKIYTSPESLAKYQRARIVLLRALSIQQAHRNSGVGAAPSNGAANGAGPDRQVFTYLMLSQVDQRLGKPDLALSAAREARNLAPMRPQVYQRIHDVLLPGGKRDEAIATLMSGILLTSDATLQRKLVEDYAANPDDSKCAIVKVAGVARVNFSCPTVHQQVCAASGEVTQVAMKTGGADSVARMNRDLASKYGCN